MNEPLKIKAKEIIGRKAFKSRIFGGIRFNSEKDLMESFMEFAKFYAHFETEPLEEKIKDGDNRSNPTCVVCNKTCF